MRQDSSAQTSRAPGRPDLGQRRSCLVRAGLPPSCSHRVTNTEGQGVALRASPGGDRLPGKGYDDGDVLTVLEQQGEWTHIRGADGRDGWVLTVTLGS